jgi:hypothetical protein
MKRISSNCHIPGLTIQYFSKFVLLKRKTLHYCRQAFFIVMLLPFALFAQQKNEYPKNYFRWPLNLTPDIVANFGKLRPNHWHMGLDIRTRQRKINWSMPQLPDI